MALVREVKPAALGEFVDAFRVLRTRPDFEVARFKGVFDDETLAEVRRVVASLRPADLEIHEARRFGRFVVHDHPLLTELQGRTVDLVSEAAGEPVEPAYSFLSLYGSHGVCPLHMDAPEAKWTLDLCLDQGAPWPILFSQVRPWPEPGEQVWREEDWEERVKGSPSLRFTTVSLEPGEAVLFSGSGQWHYRDAIPAGRGKRFCDLLFFHYIPVGAAELVRPENWARLFGIPELAGEAP